jgi:hypothetical protein
MNEFSLVSLFIVILLTSFIAGGTIYLALKKSSAGLVAFSSGLFVFYVLLFFMDLVSYLIKEVK